MRRCEVYEAMSRERIILFPTLILKLDRLSESDLIARWRGTVDLTMDYCPGEPPGLDVQSVLDVHGIGNRQNDSCQRTVSSGTCPAALAKAGPGLNNLKLRKWASCNDVQTNEN